MRVYYGLDFLLNKLSKALSSGKFRKRHRDCVTNIFTFVFFHEPVSPLSLKCRIFTIKLFFWILQQRYSGKFSALIGVSNLWHWSKLNDEKYKILWHCPLRLWKNAQCQSPEILPTSSTQTSPAHTKLQVKSRVERRMSSHFCVNKIFLQKFWINSFFLFHFRCLKLILFYIFFRKYPQCLIFPNILVVFVNFPHKWIAWKSEKEISRKSETLHRGLKRTLFKPGSDIEIRNQNFPNTTQLDTFLYIILFYLTNLSVIFYKYICPDMSVSGFSCITWSINCCKVGFALFVQYLFRHLHILHQQGETWDMQR